VSFHECMSKLQRSMNTCNKTFVIEIIHLFYNGASVTVITFMPITANVFELKYFSWSDILDITFNFFTKGHQ